MIRIGRAVRVAGAFAVVAALAGACGDGAAEDSVGSGEAALRAAAQQRSQAIAEGDYAAAYGFQSARCRLTLGQDAYVEEMSQRYAGREIGAVEADITVTVTGDTGQVLVHDADERARAGDTGPATWKYVDGAWHYDTC